MNENNKFLNWPIVEYKIMIVDLLESGQKSSLIAKEYGLNDNMIRRWRREFTNTQKPSFTGKGNTSLTTSEQELAEL